MKLLRYLALIGNVLFVLWILYNGIDEGFSAIGTPQEIVPLGLAVLLVLNIILLIPRDKIIL